jgi:thioredoxin 1
MASDAVIEFTDTNFDSEVLRSDQPVIVDFWAEWCMPCRMLTPTINELANEYKGKAKIGKIDTDANRNTAVKYGITSIPTVMLFKGGQLTKKWVGLTNKSEFKKALDEAGGMSKSAI